jgi:hypothetical protein
VAACRACSHPQRAKLEAELDAGRSVAEVAESFALSARALARHYAEHEPVESTPPAAPDPKVVPIRPGRAGIALAADEDDEPITARSTAADIVRRAHRLLAEADDAGSNRDIAALISAATGAVKALARLTGEDTKEASLASSPEFRAWVEAARDALKPFPDAMRAVDAAWRKLQVAA